MNRKYIVPNLLNAFQKVAGVCLDCGVSSKGVKMVGPVCSVCDAKEPHYDNELDQDEPERESPSVEEERDFNTL